MGEFFESIKRGLEEAIAHSKGEKTEVHLFVPQEVNVKQVREKTGLTQNQFADGVTFTNRTTFTTFGWTYLCESASGLAHQVT